MAPPYGVDTTSSCTLDSSASSLLLDGSASDDKRSTSISDCAGGPTRRTTMTLSNPVVHDRPATKTDAATTTTPTSSRTSHVNGGSTSSDDGNATAFFGPSNQHKRSTHQMYHKRRPRNPSSSNSSSSTRSSQSCPSYASSSATANTGDCDPKTTETADALLPPWMMCQVIAQNDTTPLTKTTATITTSSSSSNNGATTVKSSPTTGPTSKGVQSPPPPPAAAETMPIVYKTKLRVQGVCCATEVPIVRSILLRQPMIQMQSIQFLLATRVVIVEHTGSPQALVQLLQLGGFPSNVLQSHPLHPTDSASSTSTTSATGSNPPVDSSSTQDANQMELSEYVESTLQLDDPSMLLTLQQHQPQQSKLGIATLSADSSPSTTTSPALEQIRAWYVSTPSRTVKVEHHHSISTQQVVEYLGRHILRRSRCTATNTGLDDSEKSSSENDTDDSWYKERIQIVSDGVNEQLYLPMSDWEKQQQQQHATLLQATATLDSTQWWDTALLSALRRLDTQQPIPLSVGLSGIFWMFSLLGSLLEVPILQYAGIVSVLCGLPPVARKAWNVVYQQHRLDANVLMVLAAFGAVLLQEWDEAASVSFLFALSEHLEHRATTRARHALQHLLHLQPPHGRVVVENKGEDGSNNSTTNAAAVEIRLIPAHAITVGSLLQVRTGDAIVTDGIVEQGQSVVDESSLTGESRPITKCVGDVVLGGSLNVGSTPLIIRTTRSSDESAVGRLVRLVEQAQASSSGFTLTLIDGFARLYTPIVLVTALLLSTLSWIGGIETGRYWTYNALILIVIACPCALTIATPVTYAAALAATAQRGIIVKGGGAVLETLGSVSKIMFDKTGTLTQGKFQVTHLQHTMDHGRPEMLALLKALEGPSSHPLAVALLEAVDQEDHALIPLPVVEQHELMPGEGVQALLQNGTYAYVGNQRMMERLGHWQTLDPTYRTMGEEWNRTMGDGTSCSIGFVAVQHRGILGLYCLTDQVRPEARQVVQALLEDGYDVSLLTGDARKAAHAVANQVGLPESSVHSQLLPEDKLHLVGSCLDRSTKQQRLLANSKVMFVGDGVNDAPALATADVGMSMGDGAAVSMEMSDVTLMDCNLSKLQYTLDMGRRVKLTVRENIALSLLCKLVVVVLTFFGYMTLLYAIASDVGVMLIVTLNGMKLLPVASTAAEYDPIQATSPHHRRRRMGNAKYAGVAEIESEASRNSDGTIAEIV